MAALRGQARSHRARAHPGACEVPVGAGVPAKGCKAAPISNRRITAWRWTLRSTSQRQSLHCPPATPAPARNGW
ncbi:hypothetical protein C4Q27_10475 [Pseudomonas sp. SWI36]|nr:hypothetical protein C4Q27_10475 [Pseudomonas sp. SWI36]